MRLHLDVQCSKVRSEISICSLGEKGGRVGKEKMGEGGWVGGEWGEGGERGGGRGGGTVPALCYSHA
jgi:hypothetical protein